MVACEASGAREHGHDSKHEASSGRTNNARKGVDESIWAVQLMEHAGQESHKGEMIMLGERTEPKGPNHPRPVGPGRPAWPINGAPRLPSSAGK
jgi:hypothetical protein